MTEEKRFPAKSPRAFQAAAQPLHPHGAGRIAATLGLVIVVTAVWVVAPPLAWASEPMAGLCPADVDRDGRVGGRDIALLVQGWLAVPGDERWDAALDLNGDLVIGSEDQAIMASVWLAEDCDDSAVASPTLWTGTAEFHDSFCPGGEIFFEAYDPQALDGPPLYRTALVPEECLRSPVPGPAIYGCEVRGQVVNAVVVEPVPAEHVTDDGHHVCNP